MLPRYLFCAKFLMMWICLTVLTGSPVRAGVIEAVSRDFKPLSGYVVMAEDNEYLIDSDASQGVSVGDLFTVIRPGKKVTHPVSGKVIGVLNASKGILKVTRIRSGYSHARPVGQVTGVQRGDMVRRYDNMAATFWDYTGKGRALFFRLRNALPALGWQDYKAAQAHRPPRPRMLKSGNPALFFILKNGTLEVRDPEFQILRSYAVSAASVSKVAPFPPAPAKKAAPLVAPSPSPKAKPPVVSQAIHKPEFENFRLVGHLPGVTTAADFIRYDGRLLMAAAEGSQVRVFEVGEQVLPLAEAATGTDSVHVVRWWQPDQGQAPYLVITAWNNEQIRSAIFAFQGQTLSAVRKEMPFFLGAVDRNGDGRSETLLRQPFDRDTFWGRSIKELRLTDGGFRAVGLTINLPPEFVVTGGLLADLTGDGRQENVFVRGRTLYIYSDDRLIYKTPGMGGSLSAITYAINPGQPDLLTRTTAFEIPPVAADLDSDGRPELVAVAAARSVASAPGVYSGFKNSQLAVLKFRDGMFVKGTIGDDLGAPVQGLAVDAGRALFVASAPDNLLGKGGGSRLLTFLLGR